MFLCRGVDIPACRVSGKQVCTANGKRECLPYDFANKVRTTNDSWRSLYPFTSRELRLPDPARRSAQGLRYHYLDEGAGEPLLLLHGNPTWSFHWRNVVTAFRDRFRLIVPDHLGCGLSDKPWPYPYRLAQHIENVLALVDTLDLRRITLLAHDWGGAIGLGAAVRRPERFSRFVLFNTAAFRSKSMPRRIQICRTPILGRLAVQGANAFLRAALQMAAENSTWLTRDVRAGYLAPYGDWRSRIGIYRFVQDIPLDASHPSYATLSEIEAGLPQFRNRPVQLIWGLRDWCFTPRSLRRFQEIFPHAETHAIEHAGHWVVEDAREEVIERVSAFLER